MKPAAKKMAWNLGVWGQIIVIFALAITAYFLTPEPSVKIEVDQKEYKSE